MTNLYNISLDDLIDIDFEIQEIQKTIENISDEKQNKINWTKVWSKKYSILEEYQNIVDIKKYSIAIRNLLKELSNEYNFSKLDSMLVLKDILYNEYKQSK